MLCNFADHIVAGSFRDIIRFIRSRFTSRSNALYEKRFQVPHSLPMRDLEELTGGPKVMDPVPGIVHSILKLIFLAASNLAHFGQRPSRE